MCDELREYLNDQCKQRHVFISGFHSVNIIQCMLSCPCLRQFSCVTPHPGAIIDANLPEITHKGWSGCSLFFYHLALQEEVQMLT